MKQVCSICAHSRITQDQTGIVCIWDRANIEYVSVGYWCSSYKDKPKLSAWEKLENKGLDNKLKKWQ